MNQQHPNSQFRLSTIASSSENIRPFTMPPKLRSSAAKELPTSQVSSTSVPDTQDNILPTDSAGLEIIMEKLRMAQCDIDTISLRLTQHSVFIETTTKTIETLANDITSVNDTITNLPSKIDMKLETAYQDLRSEFSSDLKDLGTQLATQISSNHHDTNTCFKNHVTTIMNLSDTVLAITKNLTVLQENTLTKPDIEHLIVQKWEDELDPHIKSHYDFKAEASTRLYVLDTTL